MMWICPKCRHECDTAFCPTCGYEKPTQVSEMDLLINTVKKLQKRSNFLIVSVIVLLILVVGITAVLGYNMSSLNSYYNSCMTWQSARIDQLYRELYPPEEATEEATEETPEEVFSEMSAPATTAIPTPTATKAPATNITGTYKLSGVERDGEALPMDGAPEMGIILDADGTVTLTSEGESETGTWAQEGNELILTSDEGEVMTMTLEDGNLVMEESGIKMIFSK